MSDVETPPRTTPPAIAMDARKSGLKGHPMIAQGKHATGARRPGSLPPNDPQALKGRPI